MRHKVLGGFYFLRFICPALTTPEAFDLRTSRDNRGPLSWF